MEQFGKIQLGLSENNRTPKQAGLRKRKLVFDKLESEGTLRRIESPKSLKRSTSLAQTLCHSPGKAKMTKKKKAS
jgi:hypothetical protein